MRPTIRVFFSILLLSATAARAEPPKAEIQAVLFPDDVVLAEPVDLRTCLVNHGASVDLLRGNGADDHVDVTFPLGTADDDLFAGAAGLSCLDVPSGWECVMDSPTPDEARIRLRPAGSSVPFAEGETVCVEVAGGTVNAAEGLALARAVQEIHPRRAERLRDPILGVFKSVRPPLTGVVFTNAQDQTKIGKLTSLSGLEGQASGDDTGVLGTSETGPGVRGVSDGIGVLGTSGDGTGVRGESEGNNQAAIVARSTGEFGKGAQVSAEGGGGIGVQVDATGDDSIGVRTLTTSSGSVALDAESRGDDATTVLATAPGARSRGLHAQATGQAGIALLGEVEAQDGKGARLRAQGDSVIGAEVVVSGPDSVGISSTSSGDDSRALVATGSAPAGPVVDVSASGDFARGINVLAEGDVADGVGILVPGEDAKGLRSESKGRRGTGIEVLAEGQEGIGMDVRIDGEQGTGIIVATRGEIANGIEILTAGESAGGVDIVAAGADGFGVHALAEGERGTGVTVEADGQRGTGIRSLARGDDGKAAELEATGERGIGVAVKAGGQSGGGVTVETTGDASLGVSVASLGEGSVGVSSLALGGRARAAELEATGERGIGVAVRAGGHSGRGVTVETTGDASLGVSVDSRGERVVGVRSNVSGERAVGVVGETDGSQGTGVKGIVTGSGDNNEGVFGLACASTLGTGVRGMGNLNGGEFSDCNDCASVTLAEGDTAIRASGTVLFNPCFGKGPFQTIFNTEDHAMRTRGPVLVEDVPGNVFTELSTGGFGVIATGPGLFEDPSSGTFAEIATPGIKVAGNGTVNFVQNHPHRPDLAVAYTAPEGDEVGTYTRGSARLEGGIARVPLGETFSLVTNPDLGLTVQVTPRGVWADLYVEEVSTEEIVVRSRDGRDVAFDYLVQGLRIGFEEFPVLRPRVQDAPVPSLDSHRAIVEASPELWAQTARARFLSMRGEENLEAMDWSASEALISAIGEGGGETSEVDAPSSGSRGTSRRAPATSGEPAGDSAPPPATPSVRRRVEEVVEARSFLLERGGLAESMQVSAPVEPGMVVVADRERPGMVRPAIRDADPAVVGVVSGEPGMLLGAGESTPDEAVGRGLGVGAFAAVAHSGVVSVRVDATYGAVRVGDLLTTSANPGHARRADSPKAGTVLGKALEPLSEGAGLVRILVSLR